MKPQDELPFRPAGAADDDEVEIEILEVVGVDLPGESTGGAEPHGVDLAFPDDPAPPATLGALERSRLRQEDRWSDREQLLRMRVDYENLWKRLERERHDYEQQANATLVSRLLPVLDNFERALSTEPRQGGDASGFRSGVELIYLHLLEELRKEGLEHIQAVGRPFDPALHDAVATATTTAAQHNTVMEELQRGYLFRDRVLRPSMVKVGMNGSGEGD